MRVVLTSEACVCLSYRIYRQSEDQKGIAMPLHKRLPVLTVPFLIYLGVMMVSEDVSCRHEVTQPFNAEGCSVKINPVVLFERTTSPLNRNLTDSSSLW